MTIDRPAIKCGRCKHRMDDHLDTPALVVNGRCLTQGCICDQFLTSHDARLIEAARRADEEMARQQRLRDEGFA